MLNFNDVRKYVKGVMSGSFQNKETIDKLSESDGKLLFNGEEIKGDVDIATTDKAGIVKPDGTTIKIDADGTIHGSNTYTLPKATTTVLGGVKVDGTTITADTNGVIHGANTYELPVATDEVLGGVKVDGTSITVDQDGTLHGASTYELPVASDTVLGGIKVDGETVTIDDDGVISASAGNNTQVEVLPAATDEYYHKVLQYVGETTDKYIAGLFYRCVDDSETDQTVITSDKITYTNTSQDDMVYDIDFYFAEGASTTFACSLFITVTGSGAIDQTLTIGDKYPKNAHYTNILKPGATISFNVWDTKKTKFKAIIKKASAYKWEAVSGAIKGIEDINNVTITSPQNKQSLIYDSATSSWINGGASIDGINDIPDVNISNQQDKQVLAYDSSTSKWTNKSIEIPKIEQVSDINDVELTDIKDKQALIWDEANSKWVNGDVAKTVDGGTVIDNQPLGTIISYFGKTAPENYLVCDGHIYNISEYKELADFINTQFGSYNYFGGDGTTTFAVPDLRGEFLRGSGENSHVDSVTGFKNGSGSDVGEHQDATKDLIARADGNSYFGSKTTNGIAEPTDTDSESLKNNKLKGSLANDAGTATYRSWFTSRPTNTSVLYCIKYRSTNVDLYFSYEDYSKEEKVIGRWENGKPLYRKLIDVTIPKTTTEGTEVKKEFPIETENVEKMVNIYGLWERIDDSSTYPYQYTVNGTSNNKIRAVKCIYYNNAINIFNSNIAYSGSTGHVIIEYTKTTDSENSFTPDMITSKVKITPENIYSTDETIIGKWIDGKNIYRKVIQVDDINATGTTTVPHNIGNIMIINSSGFMDMNGKPRPFPFISYSENHISISYYDSVNLGIDNTVRTKATNVSIIIEYTKTTD